MRKFRINGIDRDSGYETTIIVEAGDPNLAEMEALRRGIAVRRCEQVNDQFSEADQLERAMEQLRTASAAEAVGPPIAASIAPVPAWTMPPLQYWRKLERSIAKGVFFGLLAWALLPVVIIALLMVLGVLIAA
ncbi:MAG: hypothetical protein IT430_13855 [Phycisphaerales bacterium]|nr:hypothetical protein [Phycisphaerales bacterium]